MSTFLQNSIWPNAGGTLGEIKTQIPDGATVKWPDGDALVGNFVYKDRNLVGFVDTKALTVNDSKSTTFDYDCVNIALDNISEGDLTVNKGTRCKYLTIKWGQTVEGEEIALIRFENMDEDSKTLLRSAAKVIDNVLYDANDNIIGEFNTNTLLTCHNVVIGEDGNAVIDESTGKVKTIDGKSADALYYETTDSETGEKRNLIISEFSSNLSNLFSGYGMFANCSTLSSFSSDLSKLKYGNIMFNNCDNLINFSSNLSALTYGVRMFAFCDNLTSFSSNLDNLINGYVMFAHCPNLISFKSNLSKLTNGNSMFLNCKLDTASVQNIADTINTYSGAIHIGIGNSSPNDQEINAFNTIVSKGWTVYVNGSTYTPSSSAAIATLDENGEEIVTPIPYYAKPVETTEKCADYIGEDGKYYNIVGGQFIYGDDLSTYGMFTCEEDAAVNMRLTKLEKTNKFNLL